MYDLNMRLKSEREVEGGTKFRILETATRLFAEHGLDAVPLRDIAREADVNGAAINYHFGSKELLVREVYRRLFGHVNSRRVKALDDCEVAAKGRKLQPEQIVRALVEPMVRFAADPKGGGVYFVRLLFHAYGLRREFVDESIAEQIDHIAIRFVGALHQALPSVGREELFWRFDFAIGSCLHILIDPQRSHRLVRISDGLCDTDDSDRIIDQLVASITGSLVAPSPAKARNTKHPSGRSNKTVSKKSATAAKRR
jgi:AcrR family transcriptional regulator